MKSSSATDSRICTRCGHVSASHTAGAAERCTEDYCECPWFAVDPRTGR